MVSITTENIYQLREYLYLKVVENAYTDPFKLSFLQFLGLSKNSALLFDFSTLSLYQKCAVSGLRVLKESVSTQDISRLLGQAAKIDSTPRPWVSDVFGVMAIKWHVERMDDSRVSHEFKLWISGFLDQQINAGHFNLFEKDIATYIHNGDDANYACASVPLFLHYQKKQCINDTQQYLSLINNFIHEFQEQALGDSSTALLSLMLYVFDKVNQDIAAVPPKTWTFNDLLEFLEHIFIGLKRWTWEESPRTKNSNSVKWFVENEYHVQNLLYILLAPIFNDIADEVYLQPIGQKTPRIDLYLPSLHTIIEVKYRKDTKKSFQNLIGEIGEDASLYRADPKYKDAYIVCFLWDCTRATQEYAKFKEGVLKIDGMNGCVVLSAPSMINSLNLN